MKTFYFPHDDNAAGDEKVLKLRAKFGNMEGYAMWFMLLEFLSRNGGYMDGKSMAELSICFSIPAEKWQTFVHLCTEIGLLHTSKLGLFSPRMVEALKLRKERSESGKKGAASKWGSQINGDGRAIGKKMAQPMPGEERRGENKKSLQKGDGANDEPAKKVDERPRMSDAIAEAKFFSLIESEGWCDIGYSDKLNKQMLEIAKDKREEIYRKMRVCINSATHKSTLGLAKKIFHEVAGMVNDYGLSENNLSSEEIARRREYATDEEF